MKVEKKTSIQKWLFFDEATHVPPAYRPKRSVEHKSRPFPPHPSKKSALRGKRKVIYCISHRNTRHRFKNFVFVFCFSLIKIRLLLQKHDQFHWLFQPSLKSIYDCSFCPKWFLKCSTLLPGQDRLESTEGPNRNDGLDDFLNEKV